MPLHPKKRFVDLLCFFVCLIGLLQACSAERSPRPDVESIKIPPDLTAAKEYREAFAERNPTIVSAIDTLELTVRMATPAEVPEENYKMWLYFPSEGAASLALGLVAPPMYASALVVGGALLIPLGTYGYLHEKRVWDSINRALVTAEFTRAIDRAMKDRLRRAFSGQRMPKVKIELVVEAFGLVDSSTIRQHCFVVSADFILSNEEMVLKQERLQITESNRNEDAPPPQCATLEHFAKDKAALVTDTLNEYAEVLAAMAIDRIPKGNPK